jgi:hypothetical protein
MVHDDLTTHTTPEAPVTQPRDPSAPHLPRGWDERRALLLFGLDLANRLGVPIVGIRLADHVGLSIHAECRHAADDLADELGLPPEVTYSDGSQRLGSYSREGVVDVSGLAPRTVVLVHGPRDWDHWVWTGDRSTCACGREIQ